MNIDWVRQVMDLFERSSVAELDYRDGDFSLRLRKAGVAGRAEDVIRAADVPLTPPPAPTEHAIVAGLSGSFFVAPSPGAAPYVNVGDRIEDGQVVALIEAMKTLNQITADRAGRVVRIVPDDGAFVAAGAPLVLIDPLG